LQGTLRSSEEVEEVEEEEEVEVEVVSALY